MLGHEAEDGTVQSKTDVPCQPAAEIYSTYLSVTAAGTGLDVRVERFDYDRQAEVAFLRDLGFPKIERMRRLLETGLCW